MTECPRNLVDERTWEVLELAHLAKKGAWPVAGGVLDQAAGFLEAARRVWGDEAEVMREGT